MLDSTLLFSDVYSLNDSAKQSTHFVGTTITNYPQTQIRSTDFIAPTWNFMILFFCLFVIVLNKQLISVKFNNLLGAFFLGSHSEKNLREWNPLGSLTGLSTLVNYIALLSLFLQKVIVIFADNGNFYNSFDFYIDVCTFVSAFFLFQYIFISFYGWMFQVAQSTQRHIAIHISLAASYNLALIPIILIILFYPYKFFCITGGIILLIPFFIRIIKTFAEIRFISKLSFINIFLYLCTLEIVPLMVLFRMGYRFITTGWIV